MSQPDELQIKHAIDMVEYHLSTIKDAALNGKDVGELEDLELDLAKTKEDLEKAEDRVIELEGDLEDIKCNVAKVVCQLQKLLSEISNDHPEYNVDDLENAIQTLSDL